MQEKVIKNMGEKQIILSTEEIKKLAKTFGRSENTVLNALRYYTKEAGESIREAAFNKFNAQVRVLRPMAKYDIYMAKELNDPLETKACKSN